ncbi:MAG TPA: isopentenyl-diphosphate Delta-isomerase [Cyclobacteriaceae bacterium]|jgi:isopentenyl-diphosphate delta-isomerase|nr:isopentenyl-diphosphate Delta-isomerase [Cyclobacteriaceae bacterium]
MEHVILVDEQDRETGTMEKMEAHRQGLLHRAFSILVFNSKGELLLQKRAATKYHSGGLWTNTCCSHPRKDELMKLTALRKLKQEMGIEVPLEFSHKFIYKASLDHGLTEHEYDHVLIGTSDLEPILNHEEAEDWKYASLDEIKKEIKSNPESFTSWFKIMMQQPEIKAVIPAS